MGDGSMTGEGPGEMYAAGMGSQYKEWSRKKSERAVHLDLRVGTLDKKCFKTLFLLLSSDTEHKKN